jgi:hypothetical protein
MSRRFYSISAIVLGLVCLAGATAHAQQAQGKALTAAIKATVDEVDTKQGVIKATKADGTPVWIQGGPTVKVSLTGPADPSFLTQSMYVKFTADSTKQGVIKGDIKDLIICEKSLTEEPAFSPEDIAAAANAKDKDAAIKYFIRGQVKLFKNGDLQVAVPGAVVKGHVAPDAKITAQLSNLLLTQPGDEVVIEQGKEIQAGKGTGKDATPQLVIGDRVDVNVKTPLAPKKKGPPVKKPLSSGS